MFHYHTETKSLLLKVDDPFAFRDLIPRCKVLPSDDYNLQVRHDIDATKILRNLGVHVPSPIQTDYDWPGLFKPFDHQRVMAEFHIMNDRGFNLSEPGVMKTNAALWAADYLMVKGIVRRALIISPLSTLETVWATDIYKTLMHRQLVIAHGTKEKRLDAIAKDVDFYILNHHGVNLKDITTSLLARGDIDLVIVDEGSVFRNHSSVMWENLERFLKKFPRVWWLTGTPVPNAPTDAWAQAKIMNPSAVPKFFGAFKRNTMAQLSPFKWGPRPGANEVAFNALQPAVRFKKVDVIDLPPVVTLDRQAKLTPEQRKHFDRMKNNMQAEVESGMVIDAVNAADKLGKLRQILCGAVKDPQTDTYITLPHKPRFDVLVECIQQAVAKVIVVVPFKGIIQTLAKELVAAKYTVGVMNGDVSITARNKIVKAFKEDAEPRILLCHPKVMAHGLNLTEADTTVFYAPIYSNDEYQQVIERFNRAGQKNKMTLVRIGAHPMEWAIYRAIDTRKSSQDNLLDLFRQVVTEG